MEKLGGEGFVVGQDDDRAIDRLDDLRHRECFARTGDTKQDLVAVAVGEAADELGDGFGLIAAGFVVAG